MNYSDSFIAAARRSVVSLNDAQWIEWLFYVETHNGVLTLPFDGGACFATYPRSAPPCPRHASVNGVQPCRVGEPPMEPVDPRQASLFNQPAVITRSSQIQLEVTEIAPSRDRGEVQTEDHTRPSAEGDATE